jgi:hypothetical protein
LDGKLNYQNPKGRIIHLAVWGWAFFPPDLGDWLGYPQGRSLGRPLGPLWLLGGQAAPCDWALYQNGVQIPAQENRLFDCGKNNFLFIFLNKFN